MDPSVLDLNESDGTLNFTLSGVNVSLANALRRVVLSDIKCVILDSEILPDGGQAEGFEIQKNTSRFNNEILKQRLGCIPVHIKDVSIPVNEYLVELNVKNTTNENIIVTTENFKIKNIKNGKYLSEADTLKIFPMNKQTKQFIDILRLRPKISDDIPGEEIVLMCPLAVRTAKDNAAYNVVSACAYGNSPDPVLIQEKWAEAKAADPEEDEKNWHILNSQRHYIKNSFDFTVKSCSVFNNIELMQQACAVINELMDTRVSNKCDDGSIQIVESQNNIDNCYDIIIENEDYTIGKVLEHLLYELYFVKEKTLTFCGFNKAHPHDTESIVRVAFKSKVDITTIRQLIKSVAQQSNGLFNSLSQEFQ